MTQTEASASPLSEADPESLNHLMSLNPSDMSDSQIDRVVAALRSQRAKWKESDEAKASGKPRKKRSDVSLSELGFDFGSEGTSK